MAEAAKTMSRDEAIGWINEGINTLAQEGYENRASFMKAALPVLAAPPVPAPSAPVPADSPAAEPEIDWSSWQGVLGDWMVQGRNRRTGLDTAVIFCGDEAEAKRITTARPGPSEPMRPVTPVSAPTATPGQLAAALYRFETAREEIGKAIDEAIEDVRHTLAYEWPMTTKETHL